MIDVNSLERLAGLPVLGQGGEPLGRIDAVYESNDGATATFATVREGASGPRFLPLRDAVLRGDEVVVPWTRGVVDSAPRVADSDELSAEQQQRLLAHYGAADAGAPGREVAGTAGEMVLSEERLQVGTERVETGRAVLRKHIVTETVSRDVALSHEEVRIEREPITHADASLGNLELREEVQEIVLTGERPVVEREVVPVERVRLATQEVTEQVQVTEQVRKEQVDVDQLAGAREEHTEVRTELVFEPRRDEGVVDVRDSDEPETRTEIVFERRRDEQVVDVRDGDEAETRTEIVFEPRH